jgi:NADH-quinone oxidoreductase subunit N
VSAGVNWAVIAPEVIVLVVAMAILLIDLWLPAERRRWLVGAGIAGALAATWTVLAASDGVAFSGLYVRDGLTRVGQVLALGATALGLLVAPDYLRRTGLDQGEYYVLVLVAGAGAMLMAASRDLVMLFLGLETLSIPLYVLAAIARGDARSQEAGMKYFLLGAFASAFFLYGIALLYGVTGTTRLPELGAALAQGATGLGAGAGVGLLVIGLGFKASLVPFHAWAPDVYEGAPIPAGAFMAVVAKVGAFVALVRVFPMTLGALAPQWSLLLAALAVITMLVGNVTALMQSSYKRMLAYSSIAHAGYMLVGIAVGTPAGAAATVGYLAVYVTMTLGAFAVAATLDRGGAEADRIEDYAGLADRSRPLALAASLFMISLGGLPLTGGFVAKLAIWQAAVETGRAQGIVLALVIAMTTVVSVVYYLRVAYTMFVRRGDEVSPVAPSAALSAAPGGAPGAAGDAALNAVRIVPSPLVAVVLAIAAFVVVVTGVLPSTLQAFVQHVAALVK